MDRFKFRAWHSEQKRMIDIYGLGADFATENTLDGVDPGTNCWHGEDFKLLTVMQCTGLKDIHNEDIYEGDIIRIGSDKLMVVDWSDYLASFIIKREGWMFSHFFGESCDPIDTEIVGNIHQNPELL